MATAALRAALVLAAVVLGVFVLSKAFPSPGGAAPQEAPEEEVDTDVIGESPASPITPVSPQGDGQPRPPGQVSLQVLNATDVAGLAAETAETLEAEGYEIVTVDDAEGTYDRTTIFYKPNARADAQKLKTDFFQTAVLEQAEEDVDVDVTVILAEDYVQAQEGGGSPAEESPAEEAT